MTMRQGIRGSVWVRIKGGGWLLIRDGVTLLNVAEVAFGEEGTAKAESWAGRRMAQCGGKEQCGLDGAQSRSSQQQFLKVEASVPRSQDVKPWEGGEPVRGF